MLLLSPSMLTVPHKKNTIFVRTEKSKRYDQIFLLSVDELGKRYIDLDIIHTYHIVLFTNNFTILQEDAKFHDKSNQSKLPR